MMSLVLWFLGAIGLASCTANSLSSPPEPTPLSFNVTLTPSVGTQATLVPSVEVEPSVVSLVVWLPDTILPPDNPQVSDTLLAQIKAFDEAEPLINVRVRRKKAQDIGGVLATLRSAAVVAPSALPDVALMRREELLLAVQSRLVQPLDSLMSTQMLADIYPSASQLGVVDGQMYGVPYLLEALVSASRHDLPATLTFDAVLEQNLTFAFPSGRLSGLISDTLFLQYLSAGGARSQAGDAPLVLEALEAVLNFYEQMRDDGLTDVRILEYADSSAYQSAVLEGTLDVGVVSTTAYLRLLAQQPNLTLSTIPTQNGEPSTVLNGWVWVIVTSNSERQERSTTLIEWLLAAERHREVTGALGILPSQRSVLRAGWRDKLDVMLLDQMLMNAVPSATPDMSELAPVQLAFMAVMNGELSAREVLSRIKEQQPRE